MKCKTPAFITLTPSPEGPRLTVPRNLTVGEDAQRFMFGGAGLAGAIVALEEKVQKPVIWATAHYLAFARPGADLVFKVTEDAVGHVLTQASVRVTTNENVILTVSAALGEREGENRQWIEPLAMPPVDACEVIRRVYAVPDNINARFEFRVDPAVYETPTSVLPISDRGRIGIWVRNREGSPASRSLLAVLGDFPVYGMTAAMGQRVFCNSLDNTVRFADVEPSEWVLLDIQIESMHRGVFHGEMRLFSPSGRLMAIANQSMVVRKTIYG